MDIVQLMLRNASTVARLLQRNAQSLVRVLMEKFDG